MLRARATLAVLLVTSLGGASAWAQDEARDPAGTPEPRDPDPFRRRPASARYVDLDSRLSLQGYVTGTFGEFQEDFPGDALPEPGQLLVPRTANSSFQYDWALFLGSRLSEHVQFVIETHFVTRGNGETKPDIITTEANILWAPLEDTHALRLGIGQYWAPFASVNDDWLSAVNQFATIPLASRAFPLHYNERGVRAEGEFDLGGRRGLNYVVSLGNGVSGFSFGEQRGLDGDGDKAVTARVGVFPLGPRFELGFSGFTGRLREAGQEEAPAADPRRFPSRLEALGIDWRYTRPSVEARGYGIWSREDLTGADDLDRWGVMAEASARVARRVPVAREVWVKGRWDRSRVEQLALGALRDQVFAFGLNLRPDRRANLKIEAFLHDELGRPAQRDDGFVVQMTASF